MWPAGLRDIRILSQCRAHFWSSVLFWLVNIYFLPERVSRRVNAITQNSFLSNSTCTLSCLYYSLLRKDVNTKLDNSPYCWQLYWSMRWSERLLSVWLVSAHCGSLSWPLSVDPWQLRSCESKCEQRELLIAAQLQFLFFPQRACCAVAYTTASCSIVKPSGVHWSLSSCCGATLKVWPCMQ